MIPADHMAAVLADVQATRTVTYLDYDGSRRTVTLQRLIDGHDPSAAGVQVSDNISTWEVSLHSLATLRAEGRYSH